MATFTRKFTLDDGRLAEVDGSFRFESRENIEITDYAAWLWEDREDVNAPDITLSETEDQRLYEELMADDSTWEYDDD